MAALKEVVYSTKLERVVESMLGTWMDSSSKVLILDAVAVLVSLPVAVADNADPIMLKCRLRVVKYGNAADTFVLPQLGDGKMNEDANTNACNDVAAIRRLRCRFKREIMRVEA